MPFLKSRPTSIPDYPNTENIDLDLTNLSSKLKYGYQLNQSNKTKQSITLKLTLPPFGDYEKDVVLETEFVGNVNRFVKSTKIKPHYFL